MKLKPSHIQTINSFFRNDIRQYLKVNYLVKLFIFFWIYVITARIGLALDAVSGFATPVWAPTGISLAVILLLGYRFWPGIFLAALAINFYTGAPFLAAVLIALGNTLEAVIGSYLIKRRVNPSDITKTIKGVLVLILFGSLIAPIISASIGVLSLKINGVITNNALIFPTLIAWWVGDALGALIVTPAIIVWAKNFKPKIKAYKEVIEIIALFGTLILLCLIIFWNVFSFTYTNASLIYFLFIPLIWSAIKYESRVTITLNLLLAVFAIVATVLGLGPFVSPFLSRSLIYLQSFIGVLTLTSLMLSAAVNERSKIIAELESINKELRIRTLEVEHAKTLDEAMLRSVGDGLIVTDKNGIIIKMSIAMQELTGWKIEEAINKQTNEIIFLENEKGPIQSSERPVSIVLTTNEKFVTSNLLCKRKDGSKFPISITASPFTLEHKTVGVVEILRDITEEKEIDRAKSEFISIASHQLRTPLGAIKWSLETLQRTDFYKNATDKVKEHLEDIYQSNERVINLVRDLLSVSRIEQGKFGHKLEKANIVELINEGVNRFRMEAELKNITLVIRVESNFQPNVTVDQTRFREVIENLVSNAIKYGKKGGKVFLNVKKENDKALITVEDDGIGISKKDQEHLFEKFYRGVDSFTHNSEGTGLGLYIVKSYIERWDGKIWFESSEGKGTTFYISLPLNNV